MLSETNIEKSPHILFIIPVYNDWESVVILQHEIEQVFNANKSCTFLFVNDASIIPREHNKFTIPHFKSYILNLNRNVGHQKAIAIGLSYARDNFDSDFIVVMDADGEDRPVDIPRLLEKSKAFQGIVFAKRLKRNEGLSFRFYYKLYKIAFKLLTGKSISFGNFSIIPASYLSQIVFVSDIWNHFSGGIIRSGIPYTTINTERGVRYRGKSTMNFTKLILHGLSAVAVYADIMAIRLILLSVVLIISTFIGISIVAFIRLFTAMAIPGWATFSVLTLSVLLMLSLLLGLFLIFNLLSLKTHKSIVPAKDYSDFVLDICLINDDEQ